MFTFKDGVISMVEKDFGIVLPIEINIEGTTFSEFDSFSVKIFKKINEEPIISQEYKASNNIINFTLTEEESSQLEVGNYYLDMDWYQENRFLGNIMKKEKFRVDEKAGG